MNAALHLFSAFGVELEYMLVDARTLDVLPVADQVLAGKAGAIVSDVEDGPIAWSNELVLHVLEFKTNGPADQLGPLPAAFRRSIREANRIAAGIGARLLPTAMHPWMDPLRETRLWPHDYSPVYAAFDRIFDCRGHGWSNLQSTHVNLPFADDEEFGRLHAAIRAVLPLLPALAASSPIVEERVTGIADNRLAFYRTNAERIPSITGEVVPEPLYTRETYERDLLEKLYRDIAPHDPEGTLQDEWLNARGAIARFSRMSIEIRVLDVQECPSADLAIVALVVAAVRALATDRWVGQEELRSLPTDVLSAGFTEASRRADDARIADPAWLAALGLRRSATLAEVWAHLAAELVSEAPEDPLRRGGELRPFLEALLRDGCLARRIVRRVGSDPSRDALRELYAELAACLDGDRMLT